MDRHLRTTAFAAAVIFALAVGLAVEQPSGPPEARADEVEDANGLANSAVAPRPPIEATAAADTDTVAATDDAIQVAGWGDDTAPPAAPRKMISVRSEPSPEGWMVAAGTSEPIGSGPLARYTVEVEPTTGLRVGPVAETVTAVLSDPRGWVATGRVSFQRVDDPSQADVRVVVATPATVDAWCARKGLRTNGWLSCEVAGKAMLNLDRWLGAIDTYEGRIALYRAYLVNHEVGHAIGQHHEDCPLPGAPAPVMMQQTKSLGACVPNGWVDP